MSPQPIRDPHLRRAAARAFVPGIYLGAFVVPPLGSVLFWHWGRAWTADPTLVWHFVRALKIQLAFATAMAGVQALVLGTVCFGLPLLAEPDHTYARRALFLADVGATGGLWLAMGLFGPVLLWAYGRDAALPAALRSPSPVAAKKAPISTVATASLPADMPLPPSGAPTLDLSDPPLAKVAVAPSDATRLVEPAG